MILIFVLILSLMLFLIKFTKGNLKRALVVISIILTLYFTIISIDICRIESFKEPIFVVAGETADDGGSGTYYGLGYKVKMRKAVSATGGIQLVRVEMYILDRFIVGAIADVM